MRAASDERLPAIWRCVPNGTGVGALALDPVEADFLLDRGWLLLENSRWAVSLDGWDGNRDQDGRVSVRIMRCD